MTDNNNDDNIVHFSPGQNFNDPTPQGGALEESPDPEQIAQFIQVVFSYCEGLIPIRSFIDKGQGVDGRPHNIWIDADAKMSEKMTTFAEWAAREGAAVYVIPGTVAEAGQAKASQILQMQAVVVDLDAGDIAAKREHLKLHLGGPTMVVESGGVTSAFDRITKGLAFHPHSFSGGCKRHTVPWHERWPEDASPCAASF